MKINKIFQALGMLFVFSSIIFLVVHNLLVTTSPNEDFARDIFGFPIPHPPLWTSFIPILGYFLGFLFEYISIHGLVGIIIVVMLFSIGGFLMDFGEKNKKSNQQKEIDEINSHSHLPEIIKQEFIERINKRYENENGNK